MNTATTTVELHSSHELGHHVYLSRVGTIYVVVASNMYQSVARTFKNYATALQTFEKWVDDYMTVPAH